MKRNTICIGLTVLAGLVLAVACNDMEQTPSNRWTKTTYWSTQENAEAMLYLTYANMYSIDRMLSDEALGDNLYDNRGSATDIRRMHEGYAVPDLQLYSNEWSGDYANIKNVHIFLENIDIDDAVPSAEKTRMKAEVRFIRAYTYFRLVSLFGDVPFFTESISNEEAQVITRTPKAEVLKFVHDELDAIRGDLPTKSSLPAAERGRLTQAAALLLDARVYMAEGNWSSAEGKLSQIMGGSAGSYSLFNDYAGLFEVKNEYNDEVILDVGYVEDVRQWSEGNTYGPISITAGTTTRMPTGSLVDSYVTLDGDPIDAPGSSFNPQDPYSGRDPRLTATVVYDGHPFNAVKGFGPEHIYTHPDADTPDSYKPGNYSTSSTGFYWCKYFCPRTTANMNSGMNVIMMRYAEVLLSYAEVMMEQGKMTETVWNQTIRPIRQRAGFTSAKALNYPAGASQGDLRTIIRGERRSELAMEGLRYFDIIRWKIGPETLNGPVKGAYFVTTDVNNFVFNDPRSYLFPIPSTEGSINPNLGQNPGY